MFDVETYCPEEHSHKYCGCRRILLSGRFKLPSSISLLFRGGLASLALRCRRCGYILAVATI